MTYSTIKITKLIANEGMTLTDGINFGKEVYLGTADSIDNWIEISDEKAQIRMAELEELFNI